MTTKEKEAKKKTEELEELKNHKIEEEILEQVSGGSDILEPLPNSKPDGGGGLSTAPKKPK